MKLEHSGVAPAPAETFTRRGLGGRAVQKVVDSGDSTRGRTLTAALVADFPGTSGGHALACGLEFLAGRYDVADGACRHALGVYGEDVAACYVLALIEQRRGRIPEAIASARKVVELDPGHRDEWHLLGSLLRARRDTQGLAALRGGYRKQFGADLP